MNKKFLTILVGLTICLGGLLPNNCMGQDPQFSQFYAAPMYLNPAFTGGAMNPRFIANYRNQWPSISANFITSSFSIDHFIEKTNSGVGLLVTNDSQGPGKIKSTDVGLAYSYMFRLDEQTNVRLGMQGSYVSRGIDYSGLIFGYDATNNYKPITTDPGLAANATDKNLNYMDFSGGALFYNEKSWFGIAAHHINRPNQSLFINGDTRLPIKFSVHGGINIPIASNIGGGRGANMDKQLVLSPTFLFKRQGQFNQLDLGLYATYSPMTLGVWYRGIPIIKTQDGYNNQDALVVLLGYRMDSFSVGYSYDLTISKLGTASGGSHEISVSYVLDLDREKSPNARRKKHELSCPKF